MAQFYRTDSPLSYIYTYIYTYTHTYILRFTTQSRHIFFHTDGLVLPHSGNQQSGWWLIHHHLTHPYVHTHTHKCTVCVTNSPSSYIHICMYISVSPHRVKHLSYHTDSPPSCMYIHIHTYTLFHHTELTSVLPHRWPSFTTLGKPTIWMVTYLSPSYIHAYVHTYTVCFTDNTSYYIYTLFRHTELSICFTVQIAHHHIYIYYI